MEKVPVAELLINLRTAGADRPASLPRHLSPSTETEAYRIQLQVFARQGALVAGWKASMPDAAHGFSAPIASGNLLHSPARLTDLAHPTHAIEQLGIEPEIAFRLALPLPPLPANHRYARAEVLAAIGSAHPVLEICACRVGSFEAAPPLDRLADGLMNEGLVAGSGTAAWRDLDLAALPLSLLINGTTALQRTGGHPLVDPLIPMVWMANHLSLRGIGLKAGDMVTTGSCAGLHVVRPGQHVQAEFTGLGTVTLRA